MMGIGKLIEQGKALDLVGFAQVLKVLLKGIRVTGDINNPWIVADHFTTGLIQTGTRWIYQDGLKISLL